MARNEREELAELEELERLEAKESGSQPQKEEGSFLSGVGAGLQGLFQGATMGKLGSDVADAAAADETGSEEAMLSIVNPFAAIQSKANFERSQPEFQKVREEALGRQEALRDKHPYISTGAEIVGGFAGPAAVLGEGIGAGVGKAFNAVGGGKLSSVSGSLRNRIAALGGDLETLAEKNALRSAGAQKTQMKSLINKGRVKDAGRFIIDEKIVPPGASAEDILETATRLKSEAGSEISKVFDDIEKSGAAGTFNRKELANGMRESLLADDAVGGSLDADKVMGQLSKYIDDFEAREGAASARELLAFKGKLDARINYAKKSMDLPELQQGYRNLRGVVNDSITSRAENLSNKVRGKLGERLKAANKRYGLSSEVESIAENRLAQEGNRFFSLTDSIAGAAGAAGGLASGGIAAIPAAAAGALANKALRTYGPAVGTKGIDALSKALRSLESASVGKAAGEAVEAGAGRRLLRSAGLERGRNQLERQNKALRLRALGD